MAGKKKKTPVVKTLFYYYMLKDEVKAGDLAILAELPEEKTEVWMEMNLTELILEHDSLVLEDAMEDFEAEEDQEFLKEKGISQIYAVSYSEADAAMALSILKRMIQEKGGVICSDTEDFMPILMGSF